MDLFESSSRKRKVIVAVLVLAIAAGIGLLVWRLTDDESEAAPRDTGIGNPGYLCSECGRKFTLPVDALEAWEPDEGIAAVDDTAIGRPHCPLCKARHSGWLMVTCPKCGESYVPPTGMPGAPSGGDEARDVCPKCGTDRAEWFRTHDRK